MAYLITCAGCKLKPTNKPSSLQQLSFHDQLGETRKELIALNAHIKLNWELTLPAWQLYSGPRSKLYPQITAANWTKNCIEIRILSALFGWINHTDLIPYYDLKMSDNIPQTKQKIFNYWNN
jgi:cytoplasmic iron level regulating protein YaaA (DUF328/UPF0246 family)